jgi:hypothetical protein
MSNVQVMVMSTVLLKPKRQRNGVMLTWQVMLMAVGVMSVTVALMEEEPVNIRNYHSKMVKL